jgi:hypothetical protein
MIAAMNLRAFIPLFRPVPALMLLLQLLVGALPQPASAAEVNGLYQATITVASRDDTKERQQAFTATMRQVLVKLSGRTDTLANPVITAALRTPQSYVESWAYRTSPVEAVGASQTTALERLVLEATFFSAQIQGLLESAGIPVWPSNRPDTLLWVVMQDAPGSRSLLGTGNTGSELLTQITSSAAELGLPLISPILDLQDQLALQPDVLWSLDVAAITQASARYQAESILVLRLNPAPGGQVIAKAMYLFRGQAVELEAIETPLQAFLADSVGMAAGELAANYAIVMSNGADNSARVSLVVKGIDSIAAYSGLLGYLEALPVVQGVEVVRVSADVLELKLSAGGQLRQLIESIALDRKLLPLAEPVRENQEVSLQYQWQSS